MKLPWHRAKRKSPKPPAPMQEKDQLSFNKEALEDQAYIEAYREALQDPEVRRQLVFKKWQIDDLGADPIQKKRAELARELAPEIKERIMENKDLRERFLESAAEGMIRSTPEGRRSMHVESLAGNSRVRSELEEILTLAQKMGYRKQKGGIYSDIVMGLVQALPQILPALAQQRSAQPGQVPPQQQAEQAPGPPQAESSAPQGTYSVVMPDGSLKEMSDLEYALWQEEQATKVRAQPALDASVSSAPVMPCPVAEIQPSARAADIKPAGMEHPPPEPRQSYVIYTGKAEPLAEGGPPPVIRP